MFPHLSMPLICVNTYLENRGWQLLCLFPFLNRKNVYQQFPYNTLPHTPDFSAARSTLLPVFSTLNSSQALSNLFSSPFIPPLKSTVTSVLHNSGGSSVHQLSTPFCNCAKPSFPADNFTPTCFPSCFSGSLPCSLITGSLSTTHSSSPLSQPQDACPFHPSPLLRNHFYAYTTKVSSNPMCVLQTH